MKKIILLISLLLTFQCGYKPILMSNSNSFGINEIKFNQKKLSGKIENRLKVYQNKNSVNNTFNLEISITENKTVTLKDSKGDPLNFRINVDIELKVFENKKLLFTKIYTENSDYKNTSKKFDLAQRERELKSSLINQITNNLIKDLHSIK